ncbi:unnamed protein product [Caenorhabditis angaria]|uniref:Delta-like protein n=1 Tax=Caenorhabditis angaria TaxID=860376 RepID=A0A9P1NAV9_9PELO|nr:unnamed protein product [Caenorhabditis angaria]
MFWQLFLLPQIFGAGILRLHFDSSHSVLLRQYFTGNHFSQNVSVPLFPNNLRVSHIRMPEYLEQLDYMVGLQDKSSGKMIGHQIYRRLDIQKSENFAEDVYKVKDIRLSIQWRYECDETFYGPKCQTSCNSSIAKQKRQRCDEQTGQLRCDLGWMGNTCFQVIDARLCECPTTDYCVATLANSSILECEKRHESHPDICIASPENPTETHCLNGGKCHSNGPHRFCECPDEYFGENCQNEFEESSGISTFFFCLIIFLLMCPILILTTLLYFKHLRLSRFMEDFDISVSYNVKSGHETVSICNPYTLEPKIDSSSCVLVDKSFKSDLSRCSDIVQGISDSGTLKCSELFPDDSEDEVFLTRVVCDIPRLPLNLYVPLKYDLEVKTYLPGFLENDFPISKNMTFWGNLQIDLDVRENLDYLIIHAAQNISFDVSRCFIYQNSKRINVENISESDEFQQVRINFPRTIQARISTQLILAYHSNLTLSEGIGYFASISTESPNKLQTSTNLSPYYARFAFPCFDEPAIKVPWTVTMIHPKGTRALSNMHNISEDVRGDFVHTSFAQTPKMSSYLVAFALLEEDRNFKMMKTRKTGMEVRMFEPMKNITKLKIAVNIIDYFEENFNLTIPLKKFDLVQYPIKYNAMENWGLTVFNHDGLDTMAHELAHQWFGNLVTHEFWTETWLKEGLSSLYGRIALTNVTGGSYVKRSSEFAQWYLNNHVSGGYKDEKPCTLSGFHNFTTLPIYAFSSMSYYKAPAILNMFRNSIRRSRFDNQIKKFLEENAYSNVTSATLFNYLSFDNSEIKNFLEPWFGQVGVPLLRADHFNSTHKILSQERFDNGKLEDLDKNLEVPQWNYQWDIPVWFLLENKLDMMMLPRGDITLLIDKRAILNPKGNGVFITLDKSEIIDPPEDLRWKSSKLGDAFRLLISKYIKPDEYRDMIRKIGKLNKDLNNIFEKQLRLLTESGTFQEFKEVMGFSHNRMSRLESEKLLQNSWESFKKLPKFCVSQLV